MLSPRLRTPSAPRGGRARAFPHLRRGQRLHSELHLETTAAPGRERKRAGHLTFDGISQQRRSERRYSLLDVAQGGRLDKETCAPPVAYPGADTHSGFEAPDAGKSGVLAKRAQQRAELPLNSLHGERKSVRRHHQRIVAEQSSAGLPASHTVNTSRWRLPLRVRARSLPLRSSHAMQRTDSAELACPMPEARPGPTTGRLRRSSGLPNPTPTPTPTPMPNPLWPTRKLTGNCGFVSHRLLSMPVQPG